jgi:hypothetical protein
MKWFNVDMVHFEEVWSHFNDFGALVKNKKVWSHFNDLTTT